MLSVFIKWRTYNFRVIEVKITEKLHCRKTNCSRVLWNYSVKDFLVSEIKEIFRGETENMVNFDEQNLINKLNEQNRKCRLKAAHRAYLRYALFNEFGSSCIEMWQYVDKHVTDANTREIRSCFASSCRRWECPGIRPDVRCIKRSFVLLI